MPKGVLVRFQSGAPILYNQAFHLEESLMIIVNGPWEWAKGMMASYPLEVLGVVFLAGILLGAVLLKRKATKAK